MEIRYTSINDVYGTYIFNFEDNIFGIKKINDFAVENIKSSKKVSDSVNTLISKMSKEEAKDYYQIKVFQRWQQTLSFIKR